MESQGLTPQQTAFVAAYVENGGDATKAAQAAGYASARQDGWRLRQNRAVLAAIHDAAVRLAVSGGVVGVSVLVEVAQDKGASESARVSAAKWLAEAAGLGLANRRPGVGQGGGADDKPLEDMTVRELEAFIAGGRRELDAMRSAEPVDVRVIGQDAREDTRDDAGTDA